MKSLIPLYILLIVSNYITLIVAKRENKRLKIELTYAITIATLKDHENKLLKRGIIKCER